SGGAGVGGAGDDAAELRGGGGGGGARSAGTAGVWEAAGEVLVSVAAGVRHARGGGGALLSGGDPALREHDGRGVLGGLERGDVPDLPAARVHGAALRGVRDVLSDLSEPGVGGGGGIREVVRGDGARRAG